MAALSNEAPPSEEKSQSLISKVSSLLQLRSEVPVAIETVSALRRAFRTEPPAGLASEISFPFEGNSTLRPLGVAVGTPSV